MYDQLYKNDVILRCLENYELKDINKRDEEMAKTFLDIIKEKADKYFIYIGNFHIVDEEIEVIWERKVISRAEWLESVGEDSRYQVEGDNAVEDALLDYVDGLDESDRGSLLHVDFRNLFERLRDGADVRESLEACRLPDAPPRRKEE